MVFAVYFKHIKNTPIPAGQIPFYIGVHAYAQTQVNYHPFAELVYILEGDGQVRINGRSHPVVPDTILFIPPNQMHETRSATGQPIVKFCCMFDMKMLTGYPYELDWPGWLYRVGSTLPSLAALTGEDSALMKDIFRKLMLEYEQPQRAGRNHMIHSKLVEALIAFRRYIDDNGLAAMNHPVDASSQFWPIVHHMHVHYTERLTLQATAKQFYLSESYVCRLFKEHAGKSFLEYLHQLRIDSASSLLVGTDMPVTDIAFEVGFESFRTFSRVFRLLRGMAPSEFRKQKT